ncbi:hypothetical protein B4U79_18823 [Dinothrombium tinctorium]|uniref:Uncharacterized protein n=1 Tax=Dinothrombium tinctorium TaxID=1965070 RepID=A0A443Q842_9ACAR|nr:hypothetical protein B4U79_18823 [Dinothrombium tinctorium]
MNAIHLRDQYGFVELRNVLDEAGGFPLISSEWNEGFYNWVDAYVYADTELNSQSFFEYVVDRQIIKIRSPKKTFIEPSLVIERSKLTLEKEVRVRKLIAKIVKSLRSNLSPTQIEKDITDIIKLERILLKLSFKGSKMENSKLNATIDLLEKDFTHIPFVNIFKRIFEFADMHVDKNQFVQVENGISKLYWLQDNL